MSCHPSPSRGKITLPAPAPAVDAPVEGAPAGMGWKEKQHPSAKAARRGGKRGPAGPRPAPRGRGDQPAPGARGHAWSYGWSRGGRRLEIPAASRIGPDRGVCRLIKGKRNRPVQTPGLLLPKTTFFYYYYFPQDSPVEDGSLASFSAPNFSKSRDQLLLRAALFNFYFF